MDEPFPSCNPTASPNSLQQPEQRGIEGPLKRDGPAVVQPVVCPLSDWRGFVRLRAGPLVYCLSTASILWGIAQIAGPVLATTGALSKTLPCVGVLNLYEVALLGVLTLIVVWRNVTDDAVFLGVLVALFLVASGLTLATVANDSPLAVLFVGVGSCVLAGGKLVALRRAIGVRLERLLLAALGVLLAWNFLMPAAMALVVKHLPESHALMRGVWLLGWLVILAGGAMMLLHALRTGDGAARRDSDVVFLRAPAMGWLFALTVFLAAIVHQGALTYVFDIPLCVGDFLPVAIVAAVLAVELMRAFGKKLGTTEVVVALMPLAAAFSMISDGGFIVRQRAGVGLVWHPAMALGLSAAMFAWLGFRRGWRRFLGVAICYGLAAVLTASEGATRTGALNWQAFGIALAGVLFVAGLILRRALVALAGVLVVSIVVTESGRVDALAARYELAAAAVTGLVAGFGTLVVFALFPTRLPRWIGRLAALVLAGSTVACFGGPSKLDYPFASGFAVALVGVAVWFRARDIPVALLCAVPLVCSVYVSTRQIKGWRYVAIGFALLAIGAFLSLRKGRLTERAAASDMSDAPGDGSAAC